MHISKVLFDYFLEGGGEDPNTTKSGYPADKAPTFNAGLVVLGDRDQHC